MDARSIDKLRQAIGANRPFQPDTDANDCDALVRHLANEFISVTVTCWATYGDAPVSRSGKRYGVRFQHVAGTYEEWEGDDYKQGVCELALKVLGDG